MAVQVVGVDVELEAGRETDRTERAQAVLAHAIRRIPDGADDAAGEIGTASERVADLVRARLVRDRVDGEVAAREVFVECGPEFHDRVAAIGLNVSPECGHLVGHVMAVEHANRAVLDAERHVTPEEAHDLLGRGRGGQVPVSIGKPEERVAHGTADAPRVVSGAFEFVVNVEDYRRRFEHGGIIIR